LNNECYFLLVFLDEDEFFVVFLLLFFDLERGEGIVSTLGLLSDFAFVGAESAGAATGLGAGLGLGADTGTGTGIGSLSGVLHSATMQNLNGFLTKYLILGSFSGSVIKT
tara:strand:- start:593 stop:922 length:330 start_codon:yes stop_codon:yes gene_type:complete